MSLYDTLLTPARHQAARLPTFPSVEKTATLSLSMPSRLTVNATDTRVLLTRQAAYPLFIDWPFKDNCYVAMASYTSRATSAMYAEFDAPNNVTLGASSASAPVWTNGMLVVTGQAGVIISPGTSDSTWSSPIMGVDLSTGPNPFIYCPKGTSVAFSLQCGAPTNSAGTLSARVEFEKWIAPGEVRLLRSNESASSANWQFVFPANSIPAAGTDGVWLRPVRAEGAAGSLYWPSGLAPVLNFCVFAGENTVTLAQNATNVHNFTLACATTTNTALMPLAPPTDFYVSSVPWQSTKVTATSYRAENITKIMNKEGSIMCGRINPAAYDPFGFRASTLSSLHPLEKAQLAMDKGVYTYTVPSTDMDVFVDYTTNFQVANVSQPVPLYNLASPAMLNAMVYQDPDGSSLMSQLVVWHLEFKTTSSLWRLATSNYSLEQLHTAVRRLSTRPFFTTAGRTIGYLQAPATTANRAGWEGVRGRSRNRNRGSEPKKTKGRPKSQPQAQRKTAPPAPGPKSGKMKGGLQMYLDSKKK